MDQMISNYNILDFFRINGMREPDILLHKDIDEPINKLLNKSNGYCCFVLYETEPSTGHWTLLFLNGAGDLEFFDPYGYGVDDQLEYTYYEDKSPNVVEALLTSPDEYFEVNDQGFQEQAAGVNTCGKWCCMRKWADNMGMGYDKFCKVFDVSDEEIAVMWNVLMNL